MENVVFLEIALVVIVSTILGWLSLLTRQPIIISYIVAGVLLGPWGLKLVTKIEFINEASNIGITLLLFLAGLSLHPRRLLELFSKTFPLTLLTSGIFALVTGSILYAFGASILESVITGVAMMFSSTILVVKLMPTITLHQKHMGAVAIAVLIMQDIFAVLAIAFINGGSSSSIVGWITSILIGVLLTVVAIVAERYIIRKIIMQVQRYNELLNMVALAWCFSLALLSEYIGMSHEIGAFIAGVALASGPLSNYLAENLKFFRDFFLVLFFFTLGAKMDFALMQTIVWPTLLLSAILLVLKPLVYRTAFRLTKETPKFSREMGFRLGQNSEFSLIIAVLAAEKGLISAADSQLIQLVAIVTMTASSYLLVFLFPTPLGTSKPLKID
ncbi:MULTISPECIES: cation:proton antiporter [Prosthecochloris]|uniref:Sodium:proton exchanger n=1 Tax=Prosthecochloris marina TaxID=2017681 RepID=A0A317T759_9CHLB|nr:MULTISPECIES: cation:proton antiporter [Prosthecochloris]PWW81587.1 sodium:proton exchanger [Prosthecochloris marina]UZJ37033.1 cation:proton antiporter [Prosthecochloris sp. SCSIO W1103]UZJ40014.1 cation:proton antiporter [Prosthecochloris sp. SCSIO W1102]UZJ40821.1 cation:proton antiporter [Prosthecochloris sp. SCSIO W1101]